MDTIGLVESFLTGSYTVTRMTNKTLVKGRSVDGDISSLTIRASVQPAKGSDLLRLEEARRTEETRVVFTPTQLSDGGVGPYEADVVSIDGEDWEVQHIEFWRPDPLTVSPYFRCLVQAKA